MRGNIESSRENKYEEKISVLGIAPVYIISYLIITVLAIYIYIYIYRFFCSLEKYMN